jgi:hypothetical protein
MSNSESAIDQEALERHKKVLADFKGLEKYISPELRVSLETTMSFESREHILSLAMLAIQYGRSLEQHDMIAKVAKAPQHMQVLIKEVLTGTTERKIVLVDGKGGPGASALVRQLMANMDNSKYGKH